MSCKRKRLTDSIDALCEPCQACKKNPGSRSYPNNKFFTMRGPGMHEYLLRQFKSDSVDERKARKEKDPEVDTLGVKGRSYLFTVVPNLPLTCSVDTMHHCLKTVANDDQLFC